MMNTMQIKPVLGTNPKPGKGKRIWIAVTSLLLLIVLGAMAVSAYVGWSLTHPEKRPISARPESLQLPYQDVEFTSRPDQIQLRGWLIPAEGDKKDGIVIFAHGYRNNRSEAKAALPTAQVLRDSGIASLLFDFRNSGESDGTATSVGQFEKSDLLSAIAYAKSLGYQKIGVVGYSMGAATSILAVSESKDVMAVVADSPFADLRTYLEENLPVWSKLPDFPFTPLVMWEVPLLTGMDIDQVRPIESIKKLKDVPVLLIHTKDDNKIPASNSERLKREAGSDLTELWITPGSKHVGSYQEVPDEYLQRVSQFFQLHLR